MIRLILSIALTFICITAALASDSDNYCTDKEAAAQWKAMVTENPEDIELQRLHALRLGICLKIEDGSLTLEQGVTMFEQERQSLIQKRNEEERARPKQFFQ